MQRNNSSETESEAVHLISEPRGSRSQEEFNTDILNFFIHSLCPLNSIEDKYFAKLFPGEKYRMMSKRELQDNIINDHNEQMSGLRYTFNDAVCVCLMINVREEFDCLRIGVTMHWISDDLRRRSKAVTIRRIQLNSPYYRPIPRDLEVVMRQFQFNYDVVDGVVGNYNNPFISYFKKFGVAMDSILMNKATANGNEVNYSRMKLVTDLMCVAQMLNACAIIEANAFLNTSSHIMVGVHYSLLKKCNILWGHHPDHNLKLIKDILGFEILRVHAGDWNNLYKSLQVIYKIKPKITELQKTLNLDILINEREFCYLEEYLKCLEPYTEALDILQRKENTFFGIVLPCLLTLRKKFARIHRKGLTYCKPLLETYMQSFENRFNNFFKYNQDDGINAALAALSYPRFKDNWLNLVSAAERAIILKHFKNAISEELSEIHYNRSPMVESFFTFESDSDSDRPSRPRANAVHNRIKKADLIMQMYFNEYSNDITLLNKYPQIKKIFLKYNAPLPSVEGVKNLDMNHFSSERIELIEARTILKYNLIQSEQ